MRDAHRIAARGALLSPYLVLLAAVFASPAAESAMYKCRGADGGLQFRDRPCEEGAVLLERIARVRPRAPAPAPAPVDVSESRLELERGRRPDPGAGDGGLGGDET